MMIAPIRRGLSHPGALLDLVGQSFSIIYLATAFVALIEEIGPSTVGYQNAPMPLVLEA